MAPHIDVVSDYVPSGLPLVVALGGIADAGSAVSLFSQKVFEGSPAPSPVARFSPDAFYAYSSHRPVATMKSGQIASVSFPGLALVQAQSPHSQPFLLLAGIEPDLGWGEVVAAISEWVEIYSISSIVGLASIPWPAPHTVPTFVGAHSSNPLIAARFPLLRPNAVFPATFMSVLENAIPVGIDVTTLVAHVPQYLAGVPSVAAVSALRAAVHGLTGVWPFDELELDTDLARSLELRMRHIPPLRELVLALEEYHQAQVEASGSVAQSGDTLVSQIESFLEGLDDAPDAGNMAGS